MERKTGFEIECMLKDGIHKMCDLRGWSFKTTEIHGEKTWYTVTLAPGVYIEFPELTTAFHWLNKLY